MTRKNHSPEQVWTIHLRCGKNQTRTASAIGKSRYFVQQALKQYQAENSGIDDKQLAAYVLPEIPADDMPFDKLLTEQIIPATDKKIKHANAKEWASVKINTTGPFMYLIMGDQHIDDNYCNWRLLKEHIDLASQNDHVYVLPMGDLHNNWVGRLERLYVNQRMTRDRAYDGIKWFLKENNLKIPVLLAGNHDVWNEGFRILKEIVGSTSLLSDWSARFKLVCPNGREVLIDAAHDHKGHSIYNAMHGQKRAALFGRKAHAFIGAHRHTPGYTKDWWGDEKVTCWYIRAGSYKWFDQHAVNNGFPNYQDAPAIALIIDPDSEENNPIVHVSDNIPQAMEYLTFLREKRNHANAKKTATRHP